MRVPRDVSGDRLARVLERLGYAVVRQEGSHLRLSHPGPPPHGMSVPRHGALKVGLLQSLLKDVAARQNLASRA